MSRMVVFSNPFFWKQNRAVSKISQGKEESRREYVFADSESNLVFTPPFDIGRSLSSACLVYFFLLSMDAVK
jgi:hypothetical protein